MYNKWTLDLSDSVKALDKIKDTILPKLIKGKIHSIENQNNAILLLMDTKSGIDYIRENEIGLQGIAARVQWCNKSYDTFTIRKIRHTGSETEYEKRIKQIDEGYFYPYFTLQSYFDNRIDNNILSIAVIKTVDLYDFIKNNPKKVYENKSDNEFIYVKWSDVNHLIKKYTNFKNQNE